jgi:hypothetical protein
LYKELQALGALCGGARVKGVDSTLGFVFKACTLQH